MTLREEQEIFEELRSLTSTPGFAHIIAAFCARDNFTWYTQEMRAEDMAHLYSRSRLIRTEMFTMIGLMVQANPDFTALPPTNAVALAEQAEALLSELHDSLNRPMIESMARAIETSESPNPWKEGDAMREPIFYGGEGAFSFQNCDFAVEKYAADDDWLISNKGASIAEMVEVTKAIGAVQNEKVATAIKAGAVNVGDSRLLDAFTFTPSEIQSHTGLTTETIIAIVKAFTLPQRHGNSSFKALNDFNAANAMPIIAVSEERFLLFHWNALAEAVYESPFYWLGADKAYEATAMKHRGEFTEAFALERLRQVFGDARVYQGVNIERGKGDRLGEIDLLVLFGDRAIVLQAKSKRLTLEARRGNDLQLKDDFKAAVQDAYDQAMDCSEALNNASLRFITADGTELAIPSELVQIFPICLVADHYPALAFQADQFLLRRELPSVLAPLVIDVFTLDVMAEMLCAPLRFLSYLELRHLSGFKVLIHHEITLLSYHLKYNLWLDDKYDLVALEDDFAADLEIAMGARRLNLPGKRTPDGILTLLEGRKLQEVISAIEAEPFGPMIDLVMLLYQLSGSAMKELADGIEMVLDRSNQNGSSDFSMGFANSGITIHANFSPRNEAEPRLETHIALRKYRQKAASWYGLALSPVDGSIRFGKKAAFPWKFDRGISQAANQLGTMPKRRSVAARAPKLGRNALCHCGSGKKYKKCHLRSDTLGSN